MTLFTRFSAARRPHPIAAARRWNARMLESAAEHPTMGTRWGRTFAGLMPSTLAVGMIGYTIEQGVLAASVNLTNTPFTLKSNQLTGTGMGLYLNQANLQNGSKPAAGRVAITSATLDGFCGVVTQSLPVGGNIYVLITAGTKVTGTPTGDSGSIINASNLSLEASGLSGSGSEPSVISNAILGVSADQIQLPGSAGATIMPQTSPYGTAATVGGFGLQGSGVDANGNVTPGTITIPGLNVSANDTEIAGNLQLPDLKISVSTGSSAPSC